MSGTNPIGDWTLTNVTSMSPAAWTATIDANFSVAQRSADAFAPKQNNPAAMNVLVDAGFIESVQEAGQQVITEVAAQGPLTISTAPSPPNNRIDLIVIDAGTGTASIVTGTPATSPVAPACPAGKRKIAQVSVPNGTSSIGPSNITDLRAVWGSFARAIPFCVASGSVNAITGAYTPANGSLYDGLLLGFRASGANTTTTPTFSPDGLTAHTITKKGGIALSAGDIPGALAECLVRYNLANTRWELLNPATRGPITAINTSNTTPATAVDGAVNNYTGAGANHEWDLPAGVPGMYLGFQLPDATHSMTIRPNGSDVIAAKSVWTNASPLVIPATPNGTTAIIVLAFRGSNGWEVLSISPVIAFSIGWGGSLSPLTASLGADITLNNTAIYFDGPSVAQGTSGSWEAKGAIEIVPGTNNEIYNFKLWDGATVMDSGQVECSVPIRIPVSGQITNPAGNIRISVQCTNGTTGKMAFNQSGNSMDSTLSVIRTT